MKLLLDNNIFNERQLLSKLKKQDSTKIKLFVNSIIYLELGFIYFVRQKWILFIKILNDLGIKNINITKDIAENAIKSTMLFKDSDKGASYYFRDCLIGSTAEVHDMILVTQNLKDFGWLPKDKLLKPDQLLKTL